MSQQSTDPQIEQKMLDFSLTLLVAYNAVFLLDILLSAVPNNVAAQAMDFIDTRRGWITLFEALAAVSLFADLVVRFDHYGKGRNLRVFAIAIAGAGLVFKAFTFYLNSSYLE